MNKEENVFYLLNNSLKSLHTKAITGNKRLQKVICKANDSLYRWEAHIHARADITSTEQQQQQQTEIMELELDSLLELDYLIVRFHLSSRQRYMFCMEKRAPH